MIKSVGSALNHPLQLFTKYSLRSAATCTSVGLVLLAHQASEVIENFANNLVPATPKSMASADALRERLHNIRQSGHVIVRDEWQFGLSALSVAIYENGEVTASITISGTSDRLTAAVAESLLPAMHKAAADISTLMRGGFGR